MCIFLCLSKTAPAVQIPARLSLGILPATNGLTLAAVVKNCSNSGAVEAHSAMSWLNEKETNSSGCNPRKTEGTGFFLQRANTAGEVAAICAG